MSELQERQTAAFARLSAQFEREQRQHGEQVEALRQQVEQQAEQIATLRQRIERQDAESAIWRRQSERLDERVTHLAQDYKTLVDTLNELWR